MSTLNLHAADSKIELTHTMLVLKLLGNEDQAIDLIFKLCAKEVLSHRDNPWSYEHIAFLLATNNKLNLNIQDTNGNTPLHIALINKNKEMITILMNLETVNKKIVNKKGESAQALSVRMSYQIPSEYLEQLLEDDETSGIVVNSNYSAIFNYYNQEELEETLNSCSIL